MNLKMWGCKVLKISGKNSFITIDITDKKTKQILYIQEYSPNQRYNII